MAEITGLTLGTIALASLLTTCIELFERFELGKNQLEDYHLACTKLGLLKTRLRNCKVGFAEWPVSGDHDTVEKSLLGIKSLFQNAAALQNKYNLVPKSSIAWTRSFFSKPIPITYEDSQTHLGKPQHYSRFVRRRTTWAIRDKRKFDTLLQDLDFMIQNLEKVLASDVSLDHESIMSQQNQPSKKSNMATKISAKPHAATAQDVNNSKNQNESKNPEHGHSFKITATSTEQAFSVIGQIGDSMKGNNNYELILTNQGHSTNVIGNTSERAAIEMMKIQLTKR